MKQVLKEKRDEEFIKKNHSYIQLNKTGGLTK